MKRTSEDDLRRIAALAFADRKRLTELVRFRDAELPRLISARRLPKAQALFRQFLDMALQGCSVHPSDPVRLADFQRRALRGGRRPKALAVLERLLVGADGSPKSGFNALHFAHPERVVAHEHQRRTGGFEIAYRAPGKYHSHQRRVAESDEFRADWALLKKNFPVDRHRDRKGLIRRSPNPEYNWRRPGELALSRPGAAFRLAFDFFCWKWFLWGMRGDEPMVEQLFYALTPYGTQIFIPGYWSLDAARDLRWEEIKRLHAARGVPRQGEKTEANRRELADFLQRLRRADREAKSRGLRGETRYDFLKTAVNLTRETDNAQIRRWLRELQ
jgi:hypothetical protein